MEEEAAQRLHRAESNALAEAQRAADRLNEANAATAAAVQAEKVDAARRLAEQQARLEQEKRLAVDAASTTQPTFSLGDAGFSFANDDNGGSDEEMQQSYSAAEVEKLLSERIHEVEEEAAQRLHRAESDALLQTQLAQEAEASRLRSQEALASQKVQAAEAQVTLLEQELETMRRELTPSSDVSAVNATHSAADLDRMIADKTLQLRNEFRRQKTAAEAAASVVASVAISEVEQAILSGLDQPVRADIDTGVSGKDSSRLAGSMQTGQVGQDMPPRPHREYSSQDQPTIPAASAKLGTVPLGSAGQSKEMPAPTFADDEEDEDAQILELMQATAATSEGEFEEPEEPEASSNTLPLPVRPVRPVRPARPARPAIEQPEAEHSASIDHSAPPHHKRSVDSTQESMHVAESEPLSPRSQVRNEQRKDEQLVFGSAEPTAEHVYSHEQVSKMHEKEEEEVAAVPGLLPVQIASRALNALASAEQQSLEGAMAADLSTSAEMVRQAGETNSTLRPQLARALLSTSVQAQNQIGIITGDSRAVEPVGTGTGTAVSIASASMNAFANAEAAEAEGSPDADRQYATAAQLLMDAATDNDHNPQMAQLLMERAKAASQRAQLLASGDSISSSTLTASQALNMYHEAIEAVKSAEDESERVAAAMQLSTAAEALAHAATKAPERLAGKLTEKATAALEQLDTLKQLIEGEALQQAQTSSTESAVASVIGGTVVEVSLTSETNSLSDLAVASQALNMFHEATELERTATDEADRVAAAVLFSRATRMLVAAKNAQPKGTQAGQAHSHTPGTALGVALSRKSVYCRQRRGALSKTIEPNVLRVAMEAAGELDVDEDAALQTADQIVYAAKQAVAILEDKETRRSSVEAFYARQNDANLLVSAAEDSSLKTKDGRSIAAPLSVRAKFTAEGPLGIRFGPTEGPRSRMHIMSVKAGSQASLLPTLQPGLLLDRVQEETVAELDYDAALQRITSQGRPLELVFREQGSGDSVTVTLSESGPLGIVFVHNSEAERVEVLKLRPGSQAARHSVLHKGLWLCSVNGVGVERKSYDDVLTLLRDKGRPLVLVFEPGPLAVHEANSPTQERALNTNAEVLAPLPNQTSDMESAPTTQQQASAARREIEGLYGRYNPEKLADIDTLLAKYGEERLLSMVRKKYRDQMQSDTSGKDEPIVVSFTEPGTLGLRFTPNKTTGSVDILSINPGTQAMQHAQLRPGLVLQSVDGVAVAGRDYVSAIGVVKAAGRPVTLGFIAGSSAAADVETGSASVVGGAGDQAIASTSAARREIEGLYGRYNPEKLADIDTLLAKYGEERLLSMVRKKYRDQMQSDTSGKDEPSAPLSVQQVSHVQHAVTDDDVEELDELPDLQLSAQDSTPGEGGSTSGSAVSSTTLAPPSQNAPLAQSRPLPQLVPQLVPEPGSAPEEPPATGGDGQDPSAAPSPTAGMLDELEELDAMSPTALLNTPTAKAEASRRAAAASDSTGAALGVRALAMQRLEQQTGQGLDGDGDVAAAPAPMQRPARPPSSVVGGVRALAMQRLEQQTGQDLDGDGRVGTAARGPSSTLPRPARPSMKKTPPRDVADASGDGPLRLPPRPAAPKPLSTLTRPEDEDEDDESGMLAELAGLDSSEGGGGGGDDDDDDDDDMLASLAELEGM